MIFKKIYKKAVSWHKYIGLFLSIILVWMSVSGILLNHPDLIANIGISKAYFPDEYIPENWNRGGIQDIVYLNDDTFIIGGKQESSCIVIHTAYFSNVPHLNEQKLL